MLQNRVGCQCHNARGPGRALLYSGESMLRLKTLARSVALLTLLTASSLPAHAQRATPDAAPEIATGYSSKTGWTAQKYMMAAANPLATEAGYQMLKRGGSSIDAAIATQMVLTLVEPQSSGIGGGSFLMYYDGKHVESYDGRETAPAAADEHLFQHPDGTPLSRSAAIIGGRSVGAPGVLRMLELAHKEHGKLAWDQALKRDPVAAAYFYDKDGKAWPVGHLLKNPELARTLREIARGGAD